MNSRSVSTKLSSCPTSSTSNREKISQSLRIMRRVCGSIRIVPLSATMISNAVAYQDSATIPTIRLTIIWNKKLFSRVNSENRLISYRQVRSVLTNWTAVAPPKTLALSPINLAKDALRWRLRPILTFRQPCKIRCQENFWTTVLRKSRYIKSKLPRWATRKCRKFL